jgi:hypothetical protein
MPVAAPTFTVALLLAALGLKITDFVKYFISAVKPISGTAAEQQAQRAERAESVNGLITMLVTVVVSIVVIEGLLKNSAWGDEITIGKEKLSGLGTGSVIVFGIVFTALAGTLYDFKKAVDNSDTAKKPKLVKP